MPKLKLVGTEAIPEGAHINLGAAGVIVDGHEVTQLRRGQVLEADSIVYPDRLEAAIAAGMMTMDKIGAAPKAVKSATGD